MEGFWSVALLLLLLFNRTGFGREALAVRVFDACSLRSVLSECLLEIASGNDLAAVVGHLIISSSYVNLSSRTDWGTSVDRCTFFPF